MSVAKIIEISAESETGFDDAVQKGIQKAAESVKNIESAWIKDHIILAKDGKISGYRVHMTITFRLN